MNRSFFAAATMLALFSVSLRADQAHAQAFSQNSTSFTTGYGLSNLFGNGFSTQSLYGPYHFKIEKGLTKHLSLGLSASLARDGYLHKTPVISEVSNAANSEMQNWAYSAVARLNLHVGHSKKFDPYLGAGLGYRSSNWTGTLDPIEFEGMNYYIPNTPIAYEFGIGARYYLLPFLGVYAELNAGKSPLQGGIIFNIPGKKNGGSGVGGGNNQGNGNTGGTTQGKNKGNKMNK